MERTRLDSWTHCETGRKTFEKSNSFVGNHYFVGSGLASGTGLFGTLHVVVLRGTAHLPRHAPRRTGSGWHGHVLQHATRRWTPQSRIRVGILDVDTRCHARVRINAILGPRTTMDQHRGILHAKLNLLSRELLLSTLQGMIILTHIWRQKCQLHAQCKFDNLDYRCTLLLVSHFSAYFVFRQCLRTSCMFQTLYFFRVSSMQRESLTTTKFYRRKCSSFLLP